MRTHAGGTTMACDENCNPTTEDTRTHAQQVTKSDLEKKEETNSSQQQHNVDGLNEEMLDCNVNEEKGVDLFGKALSKKLSKNEFHFSSNSGTRFIFM